MSRNTATDDEDRTLLARISNRDEPAFLAFYRKYGSAVYALARRITGRDHDAEEVVADVFWELWQRSDRYCPTKASPYAYLILMTRCRALDRKRGLSRQTHAVLEWVIDEQPSAMADGDGPEAAALAAERCRVVARAIRDLEPAQRQAVELAFFEGLSHRETAEKLGIPLGTVKGRIRAAIDHLRFVLDVE